MKRLLADKIKKNSYCRLKNIFNCEWKKGVIVARTWCVLHFQYAEKKSFLADQNQLIANNRTICVSMASDAYLCILTNCFRTETIRRCKHKMKNKHSSCFNYDQKWIERNMASSILDNTKWLHFHRNKKNMNQRNPAVVHKKIVLTALSSIKANEFT